MLSLVVFHGATTMRSTRPRACAYRRAEPILDRQLCLVALLGLGDLDCAEAFEWAVDEEDLHRDVGLDVRLA